MLYGFVEQWNERKHLLEASFRDKDPEGYYDICERLVRIVLHDLNPERIHVVDDGEYQGVQIFLIANHSYQPDAEDYVWFSNYYGSCSGCDTYEALMDDCVDDRVGGFMDLALHMVQRMKRLV